MRKGVIGICIVLLLAIALTTGALAQVKGPVEVKHEDVKASILLSEVGRYSITVVNHQKLDDVFYLSLDDIRFSPTLNPLTDYTNGIKVGGNGMRKTELFVVPNAELRIGEYHVRLDLRSKRTGQVYSDILTIYIAPDVKAYLAPNVSVQLSVDKQIDPRKELTLRVQAHNNNELDMGEVQVDLKSGLFHREQVMVLGPNGDDEVSFQVSFDPFQEPRDDFVVATVAKENLILGLDRSDVKIIEYSLPFEKNQRVTTRLLRSATDIHLVNKGNVRRTEDLRVEMPWYRSWFSDGNGYEKTRDGGKRYWVYHVTLDAQEEVVHSFVTSYRMPALWILFIVVGYGLYLLLRSPLVISKHAKIVERNEGGITKMKIYLHMQNRSSMTFDDIRVVDKIASIAKVVREKQLGTLAPSRVGRKGSSTLIEWKIPKLDGGEERVIHYKIESRLSILGDFKLKRAMVEYAKGNVRSQSFSNEFFMDVQGREISVPTAVEGRTRSKLSQ